MAYTIVRFIDEVGDLGIVHSSWVSADGNSCRYPPVRTNMARDQLLKKGVAPAKDWMRCKIKVLQSFPTYQTARSKLNVAEVISNLDSESEVSKKRKNVLPSYFDESSPKKMNIPQYRGLRVNESDSEYEVSKKRRSVLPSYFDESPPKKMNILQYRGLRVNESDSESDCEITPTLCLNRASLPNDSPNTSRKDDALLLLLTKIDFLQSAVDELIESNRLLTKKVDSLTAQANYQEEDVDSEYGLLDQLPASTLEDFLNLQKKLKTSSSLRKQIRTMLLNVGGRTCRICIVSYMKRVMADNVAMQYSFKGRTDKLAFIETPVYHIILSLIAKLFDSKSDIDMAKQAIADWLCQANTRFSRRSKRSEMNHVDNFVEIDLSKN